jgi:tetratricopeptide (TPR) repeat protein
MHRLLSFAVLTGFLVSPAISQDTAEEASPERGYRRAGGSATDFAASRLFKRGQDLILVGEFDRGVKMLESVAEQYPDSELRYQAWLALGKHFISQFQQPQAIIYLAKLRELERLDEEHFTDTSKEMYLEGLYLTGVAYYQTHQFAKAFPVLRRITTKYQNTVWSNQAYYYIGMCHFAKGNWNKAIESLNLVGTFVDPDSAEMQFVEAGRRFYVKIEDGDFPILQSLNKPIELRLQSAAGDEEIVQARQLPGKDATYISSTPTIVGPPRKGDGILQIRGRDTIKVTYIDDNTKLGEKDVTREKTVQVVSTGSVSITTATFEQEAVAAFLKQPLFLLVRDADEDTTPQADQVKVRVICRYREKTDDDEVRGLTRESVINEELGFEEEEVRYTVRDEVTLTLTELAPVIESQPVTASETEASESAAGTDEEFGETKSTIAPAAEQPLLIHSGRFGGSVQIHAFEENENVDKTDAVLSAAVDDEVIVTFVDDLHITGRSPRVASARRIVGGELNSGVTARQNVVRDELLKARKGIVEATALLELARLFDSMGLKDGAETKAVEGLGRVDPIIRVGTPIPSQYKEEAFQLKWELYIVQNKFAQAIETCKLFNRLYPDSPFVDQALMGIGEIRMKKKEFDASIKVFSEVLTLDRSEAKGEAQFRIAQAMEVRSRETTQLNSGEVFSLKNAEGAVRAYRLCAEKYSDSPYAGPSLAKLIDYYMETRDHVQADDLLEQVFDKYPDATFLDEMLLKWVKVAYRTGNYAKALEKCQQLIFEYPGSAYASSAKEVLPLLEKRVGVVTEESADSDTEGKEE